jgi:hypothetical protein
MNLTTKEEKKKARPKKVVKHIDHVIEVDEIELRSNDNLNEDE